jgi:1-hydroxycarotenoid 3,4-desaturase
VIVNADAGAVSRGLLGDQAAFAANAPVSRGQRSLSAVTWALEGRVEGFDLHHHTVFFGSDYAREFDTILKQRRLPDDPTVYVCAQDRGHASTPPQAGGRERLLVLVNAPPDGDRASPCDQEMDACTATMLASLERRGLKLDWMPQDCVRTGPMDLEQLFPGTGGAIYGPAPHGPFSPFRRAGARTRMDGLYLAGGSVHPSAGVPMAALSGLSAARALLEDQASTRRFHRADISGGTSMPSPMTARTA